METLRLGMDTGVTEIVEAAVALEDATLVTVTVAVVAVVTVGAVNRPLVETDPALALHRTCVFVVPVTVALNCWVPPEMRVALAGVTVTRIAVGAVTEIVDVADAPGEATLVAVTVAVVAVVTVGAVNKPPVVTDPALALQRTCVLVAPTTVAASCWLPPDASVALAGVTVTVTGAGGFGVTESLAEAVAPGAATLVAVTVAMKITPPLLLGSAGAVNRPLAEMDPALALHRTC